MKLLLVSFDIRSFHLNVNNRDVKAKSIFVRCLRNRNRKLCRKEASGEAFPFRDESSAQWAQFLNDAIQKAEKIIWFAYFWAFLVLGIIQALRQQIGGWVVSENGFFIYSTIYADMGGWA